jgi:hypothetical protein
MTSGTSIYKGQSEDQLDEQLSMGKLYFNWERKRHFELE